MELQKLVRRGLDGVRVFHTLFRRWVASLAERTRPMWKYNGPMDPDRASPEELPNDEVWSRLHRVLQLRPKEILDGKAGPLNAMMVSKLVCSPLFTLCSFPFALLFFILSRLFCRDLKLTSPARTFRRARRARLGRPPRRRRRMPRRRRRKPRWLVKSMRRRMRSPGA